MANNQEAKGFSVLATVILVFSTLFMLVAIALTYMELNELTMIAPGG